MEMPLDKHGYTKAWPLLVRSRTKKVCEKIANSSCDGLERPFGPALP